jgi:nucleotide-binding universal stress UspA family protein
LLEAVLPDALETGPPAGTWRHTRAVDRPRQRLFADILVPVTGREEHWFALSQALQVAQREGSRVLGLHVVGRESQVDSSEVHAIRAEFYRRCSKHGIPVQFAVDVGPVARVICDRSWWTDLVVVRLTRSPAPQPLSRLSSGFRTMVRRCGGPLLVVPRSVHSLDHLLLAYNEQAKAREALFLAAYLASRWQKPLTVVTVREEGLEQETVLADAQRYLGSQGVRGQFVVTEGPVVEAICATATAVGADAIIMGGYGSGPVVEIARDSKVNEMLRSSRLPLLICR